MERFLRYSLEKQRPIRLMLFLEGKLVQRKAQVIALEENQVCIQSLRPRQTLTLPLEDILGAEYARGDEGET